MQDLRWSTSHGIRELDISEIETVQGGAMSCEAAGALGGAAVAVQGMKTGAKKGAKGGFKGMAIGAAIGLAFAVGTIAACAAAGGDG
jgi:hypothetical protein